MATHVGSRAVPGLAVVLVALFIALVDAMSESAATDAVQREGRNVIVVGVPGLRWSDVSATSTPAISAQRAAVYSGTDMYTIFSPVCLESRISWFVRFFLCCCCWGGAGGEGGFCDTVRRPVLCAAH